MKRSVNHWSVSLALEGKSSLSVTEVTLMTTSFNRKPTFFNNFLHISMIYDAVMNLKVTDLYNFSNREQLTDKFVVSVKVHNCKAVVFIKKKFLQNTEYSFPS